MKAAGGGNVHFFLDFLRLTTWTDVRIAMLRYVRNEVCWNLKFIFGESIQSVSKVRNEPARSSEWSLYKKGLRIRRKRLWQPSYTDGERERKKDFRGLQNILNHKLLFCFKGRERGVHFFQECWIASDILSFFFCCVHLTKNQSSFLPFLSGGFKEIVKSNLFFFFSFILPSSRCTNVCKDISYPAGPFLIRGIKNTPSFLRHFFSIFH